MSTACPDQMVLFDCGLNVSRLREARARFMRSSRSASTVRAYAHCWRSFASWCCDAGRVSLPASTETVSLFVAWCLEERGYRLETVKLTLSAIAVEHREAGLESPVDASVRGLVSSAARELRERPAGKAALTPEQLRRISDALLRDGSPHAVRDRAIVLDGFAAGWRGGELASLQLSDARFVEHGLRLHLGASKTDQEGKGRLIGIPYGRHVRTCPVRALRAWVDLRGGWPGPLFTRISLSGGVLRVGITGETVCDRVKRALELVREDSAPYGAHSLRAGMATAGAENGASEISIMQRGGWRDIRTVLRYVRPAQVFRADPLAGVL